MASLSVRLLRLLFGLGLFCTALAATERPNIIWVVSEDNNPWLGCYGDPLARTPTLDALAARGIRYRAAHSPSPVCAPSRSSIISGRYAPGLGTQHMRSLVPLPTGLRYFTSYLREAGYYCTNRAKTDYNTEVPPGTWDENGNRAHWKNRPAGRPFFAVFNFASTHESNLHERRPLQTDPAKVRVPAYLPDTPEVRADIAQYHDCHATMDGQIREVLSELESAGVADDTIIFYYGDNGGVLPRSKRFLYHNGTHVPLIIAFPPKWAHLAPAAAGTASDEMVTLLDLPATVLSLAGVAPPTTFEGRALAGDHRAPAPPFVHAFRDRMDEVYDLGRAVIGPRYRYIRNYRPELPAGQHLDYLWRMASMRDWERLHRAGALEPIQSAFFLPRAPEMLFDTATDPDCVRNLASDPAHRAVLEEMRTANRAHLLATRDLGFMPEPMIRHLADRASPTVVGADDASYPLAALLSLIDELQLPAAPPPAALNQALASPLAVVRYWGAVAAVGRPDNAELLRPLLQDADASVRLAAAFSILKHRPEPIAWAVVGASLRASAPEEDRLTAINAVVQLGSFPDSIRQILTKEPAPPEDPSRPANYSFQFGQYYERQLELALGRKTPEPKRKE